MTEVGDAGEQVDGDMRSTVQADGGKDSGVSTEQSSEGR